ncbi:MAG: methyltransferase [Spirochaetia bacterium]
MSTDSHCEDLTRWFYKSVPFRWNKIAFEFSLSHALFSSDRIDTGSTALLSVLEKQLYGSTKHGTPAGGQPGTSAPDEGLRQPGDTPAGGARPAPAVWKRVYDIGCGAGVLGIVAGKGLGAHEIILEDRDSLAVALSGLNAKHNGVGDRVSLCPRPTGAAEVVACDLVVCNLPAKATEEVQRLMLRHGAGSVAGGGLFLVVVVNTLADSVHTVLTELDPTVVRHPFREHTVFVARPEAPGSTTGDRPDSETHKAHGRISHDPPPSELDLPDAYHGEKRAFTQGSIHYHLTTIHGLGEFDTPSFTNRMLTRLTAERCAGKHVLLFESGPGHVCTALQSLPKTSRPASIIVAARNTLAGLATTRINSKWRDTRTFHVTETPLQLTGLLEDGMCVVLPLEPEPYTPLLDEVSRLASAIAEAGGTLILAGRSGAISEFERYKHPLSASRKTRSRGVRGLVLDSHPA